MMLKRLRKFIAAEWWNAFAREAALPNPAAMAFLIDTAARELEELAAMYDRQAGRRAAGTATSKVEAYNMGLHRGKAIAYQAAAERLRSIPGTSS
jgi:hypothetical protein